MVSSQKGPVMQSFDVFFAIDLNKLLSCQKIITYNQVYVITGDQS